MMAVHSIFSSFIFMIFVIIFKVGNCDLGPGVLEVNNQNVNNSNGFGELYEWHLLEEGLTLAEKEGKPLIVIIHKSYCGACKALKSKFAVSESAQKLSTHFIMVNIAIEEDLQDEKFSPDGKYVPRIFFLDSGGHVHHEIYNKQGNSQYKYFYYDVDHLLESMKNAISMLGSTSSGKEL